MPTPNQVMERNDLFRCLSEQRDIGPFRWLPDALTRLPTGIEFVQYELNNLHREYGRNTFPCQLTHDPCRPRDAHAMQIRTIDEIIGYVPDESAGWWQQQFDQLGDPRQRLVGLCRVEQVDAGARAFFKPTCQFRVQLPLGQLRLL